MLQASFHPHTARPWNSLPSLTSCLEMAGQPCMEQNPLPPPPPQKKKEKKKRKRKKKKIDFYELWQQ